MATSDWEPRGESSGDPVEVRESLAPEDAVPSQRDSSEPREGLPQHAVPECDERECPLVSVVIPFYSEVHWLQEAVESVRNQDYSNIEVILVNDGSSADLSGIIREYGTLVRIINKGNGGPASARNAGMGAAVGKYIAFLDSDDTWYPAKLSAQVAFMESTGMRWSQHSYRMFWDSVRKSKIIDTSVYSGDVLRDCFISFRVQTSSVMILRTLVEEYQVRFPTQKRYGEDVDFYSQLASVFPLGYVPGVLSRFRMRGSNAGFNASIQIRARASTWRDIEGRSEILKLLPRPVLLAYAMCGNLSDLVDRLSARSLQGQPQLEPISRVAYAIPYLIFRLSGRR